MISKTRKKKKVELSTTRKGCGSGGKDIKSSNLKGYVQATFYVLHCVTRWKRRSLWGFLTFVFYFYQVFFFRCCLWKQIEEEEEESPPPMWPTCYGWGLSLAGTVQAPPFSVVSGSQSHWSRPGRDRFEQVQTSYLTLSRTTSCIFLFKTN